MRKKSVSISISEDVWDGVREAAWRQKKSASQYLEDLITVGFKTRVKRELSNQEELDKDRSVRGSVKRETIERSKGISQGDEAMLRKVEADVKDRFKVPFRPQPKGAK
jgi:hypothetical protein